jgi:hypothetical protein
MAILDNVDNNTYPLFETEPSSLSVKIFLETVCKDCEHSPMSNTDNMGREKFWEYSQTP